MGVVYGLFGLLFGSVVATVVGLEMWDQYLRTFDDEQR